MNKQNKLTLLTMTVICVLLLVFVGTRGEEEQEDVKGTIGLVTDSGGVHDKSFNQNTHEALEKYAEENGYKYTYIESADVSQLEGNLNASASRNDIVIASGYLFEDALYKSAIANPDTMYVGIDCEPKNGEDYVELDNVKSYYFNEQDSGFLAGYIAGKTSKTNKLGFIGGQTVPAVTNYEQGFKDGAKVANPDVTVETYYANSFTDVALGKNSANVMFSKDIDIIFTAAGGVNAGAIEQARTERDKGNDVWIVGVDSDMYEDGMIGDTGESLILTSALKNTGVAAVDAVNNYFNGAWESGLTTLTYEDNKALDLPETNPNVDDSLIEEAHNALITERGYNG